MNKLFTTLVVIGLPLSVIGAFLNWSDVMMFIIYCITILALAAFIGRATESLALILGPRIGGLLNATFGNAVELIISFFALKAGLIGIVLASLTGSVIGNLLLVGGLAFFVGGLKFKRQAFNEHEARNNSGLLIFAIIVAFVIPEVFTNTMSEKDTMTVSVGVSIILIVLYLAGLFFKLVTHRGVYPNRHQEQTTEMEEPEWGKMKAIIVLAATTVAVAFVSDNLVDTLGTVGETFGWSELFIGVIIVAIVGNAAEHSSAIIMAYKNKMDVAVEIAVGSTLQIAMFVLPLLVLYSLFLPTPMPLLFTWPELISMVTAVILTVTLTNDGDSNWFEGVVLLAAYFIMAIGFYFI